MTKDKPKSRVIAYCADCGLKKLLACRGICYACYGRIIRPNRDHRRICKNCGDLKSHYKQGLCYRCFKVPGVAEKFPLKNPGSPGQRRAGRPPLPGNGKYIVALCKPGDETQDEILLLRMLTADLARAECRCRNLAARQRGNSSKCFYFVHTERSVRLPWVDKMLKGMQHEREEEDELSTL